MEEAISQLQDLGVTRGQAKKALARYNNDVARAADYIFSGATLSDEELEQSIMETDEELAIRLSKEEEQNNRLAANETSNPFQETTTPPSPTIINSEPEPVQLDKTGSVSKTNYDSSKWSVVPFKESQPVTKPSIYTSTTNHLSSESSLTWWKDPEDPSERVTLKDLPNGLRPPTYNFAYSPILLQSLFHISALAHGVLAFRPTPYSYGQPKGYWKGYGDPVPGYLMREVISKRPVTPIFQPEEELGQLSLEDKVSFDQDFPPLVEVEHELVEQVENELQLMPPSLQALAELQKIFGFLGFSARLYGSASHFVRSLNSKLTSNGWEFSDKTFENFFEMVTGCLTEADEHSENKDETNPQKFRDLFLLKAKIEYGDYHENEEVHYLTVSIDKNMDSFHNCLDPLVYESYPVENWTGEETQEDAVYYKFTTFEQIPPILTIMLENRTAPKKTPLDYTIDRRIYMDRYLIENQERTRRGFCEMEQCRQQIEACTKEIETITTVDQRQLLAQTLTYFEQQGVEGIEGLRSVLDRVRITIEAKLARLEAEIAQQKSRIQAVFDSDEFKQKGYGLRATYHHDGKSGTGHYWAYIWVESDNSWFRFCDAYVTKANEEDIHNDPVPPFALMYVSDSLATFTKDQLFESISEELKDFIKSDNTLLTQEIYDYDQPVEGGDESLVSMDDDAVFIEKPGSPPFGSSCGVASSSVTFDDNTSVGTAVNGQQIESTEYSFTGQESSRFKEIVNSKIIEASNYPSDDYRFLKNFDNFLARSQNQLISEHVYLLYSSEKPTGNGTETELVINEMAVREDSELQTIWKEYDSYLEIGKIITQALSYFTKKDFKNSLLFLLEAKRKEASWKTKLMLDTDVFNSYSGLETLSFDGLIGKYGKMCLKVMNKLAFSQACHPSYRTRGLEDAIRLAHYAQTIIGPDNIQHDEVYNSLGALWLSFTEQENVGSSLSHHEAGLLNTLILIYLEGQMDRVDVQNESVTLNEADDKLPLWEKYLNVTNEAEKLLQTLLSE